MTTSEQSPNFGDNSDTAFESILAGVLPDSQDWEAQFAAKDREIAVQEDKERQSVAAEVPVIEYLENKIADVAALKTMLAAIERELGEENPTCYHVMSNLDDFVREKGGLDKMTKKWQKTIDKMYALSIVVQQLARSETRETDMSKDQLLTEIVMEERFTPEEKNILVDATDIFLASE